MISFRTVILLMLYGCAVSLLTLFMCKGVDGNKHKTLVLCLDGSCWDDKKYIGPTYTIIPLIKKHGHPEWMTVYQYNPEAPETPEEPDTWD